MTSLLGVRRASVSPAAHADRPHPEDAEVLLPTTIPAPSPSKSDAIWRIDKYVFRADFDSANLDSVDVGGAPNEFLLQTRRDCGGTENEKATRTWFYFSVHGHNTGELIVLTILNLNKQSRLYSQDYRPFCWCASQPEWQQLRLRVTYRREGDDFQLRFCHRFDSDEETLFAFAIPFSYQQTQEMLDHLDQQVPFSMYGTVAPEPAASQPHPTNCAAASSPSSSSSPADADAAPSSSPAPTTLPPDSTPAPVDRGQAPRPGISGQISSCSSSSCSDTRPSSSACGPPDARIYYRRQLLTRSLHGRRVDVITITDCWGATAETEPPIPGVFEHDPGPPAAVFRDKTVFFISSRVHPGETPATHIFNGMLAFLLRRTDPRAAALRRRFVFKLVPLVNPDGVAVGNYRTDTLGQNLNRFYTGIPDQKTQSSVYAIKSQLMFYAQRGLLEYYIDLHAHANKKGVFIYGNTLEDGEAHMQSLLYAKLVALNNASFDFIGCNYTEKNMSRPDKDGVSKEGAGRVALYRETGLTHLYTIEANYNTARTLNVVPPAAGDHGGRASPPCSKRFPSKFTVGSFHGVGRAILVAALDMENLNPWSRLPHSEHRSLEGMRSWISTVLRATSETRAAHLPPMGDAAVEMLRSMISSGALRGSSGQASASSRTRHRTTAPQTGEPAASSSVTVAFGRTVCGTAPSTGRRLPPPSPAPARRTNASLPVIQSGMHGSSSANAIATPAVAGRRSGTGGSSGGASVDGLARSASLPVRSSTPLTPRLSPRTPNGCPAVPREVGCESATTSELGIEDADAHDPGDTAVDLLPPSAEGPSDSDGDDAIEETPVRVGSPAPANPPAAASAPSRFRSVDAPLRTPPPPSPTPSSYKGAAVYCGRVTEFKFPLADRVPGVHDASTASSDGGLRGSLTPSGPGQVAGTVRSRPPSASGFRRPPSPGGAGITSAVAASSAAAAGAAGGNVGGSGGAAPLVASVASARHMFLPRTLGTGAAVLMTPEQLSAGAAGAGGAPRGKSTLSFARSSSASRRSR